MGVYFTDDDKFDEAVRRASNKYDVPAYTIKGLIAAESSFRTDRALYEPSHSYTRSDTDTDASYGLMQLTGTEARRLGWVLIEPIENLFDPDINIDWGTRALAAFIKNPYRNFSKPPLPGRVATGQPRLHDAIASYNMGHPRPIGNTTPDIARIYGYPLEYRDTPPPGWVYANQPYVDRVLAYSALYRAVERGDTEAVNRIIDELKKKDSVALRAYSSLAPAGWHSSVPVWPDGWY